MTSLCSDVRLHDNILATTEEQRTGMTSLFCDVIRLHDDILATTEDRTGMTSLYCDVIRLHDGSRMMDRNGVVLSEDRLVTTPHRIDVA